MLIAVKVIGVVAYLIGIAAVAIQAKTLMSEGGDNRDFAPVMVAVLWPVALVIGVVWSLTLHLSDWVSK